MDHARNRNGRRLRLTLTILAAQLSAACASLDRVSYVPPAQVASRPAPRVSAESLSVLWQNVGMPPGPFGSNNVERAERICDRLTSYEPADVIVLLEVFDEAARAVFIRRLSDRWPWIVRRSGGGSFLPEDSGILLASRLPIVVDRTPRIAFQSFRAKGPMTRADHWAAKGVLGVEVDLGARRSLCLLATHLMADYEVLGQYEQVRRRQLQEVVEFGRQFVAGVRASRRSSVLLVGDLNVPAEKVVPASGAYATRRVPTAEYQHMLEVLQRPTDLYRVSHDDAGWTWNHDPQAPGADPALGPQRLDYGFVLTDLVPRARRSALAHVETSLLNHPQGIADHRGLQTHMAFREAAPTRTPRVAARVAEVAETRRPPAAVEAATAAPPTIVALAPASSPRKADRDS